jgi:hypothetical protein
VEAHFDRLADTAAGTQVGALAPLSNGKPTCDFGTTPALVGSSSVPIRLQFRSTSVPHPMGARAG